MEVESAPGRGSSFHVFASRRPTEPPLGAALRAEMSDADRHGTETVLLVEDDSSVRSLLRDVLTDAGYSVLASGSLGTRGRGGRRGPQATIHLLLCDVVLPDGSGRDPAPTLLGRHARPCASFTCPGYTDDELQRAGLPENAPLVRKPLSGDELLLAVRSLRSHGPD